MPSLSSIGVTVATVFLIPYTAAFGLVESLYWLWKVPAFAPVFFFIVPPLLYVCRCWRYTHPWTFERDWQLFTRDRPSLAFVIMQLVRDWCAVLGYIVTLGAWLQWVYLQQCAPLPLMQAHYAVSQWLDFAVFVAPGQATLQLLVYAGLSAALWFGSVLVLFDDVTLTNCAAGWTSYCVEIQRSAAELDAIHASKK